MSEYVLVWDLETIPDLACVARVNGLADGDDEGARAALGDNFPEAPVSQGGLHWSFGGCTPAGRALERAAPAPDRSS